jgi:undecaprenyl-diphosphatase
MAVLKAVVLGIIQGLTEFLPVSSSGHLVLFERLLGFDLPGVTFEIFVHLGTLLAVLMVYSRDVLDLVGGFFSHGGRVLAGRMSPRDFWGNAQARVASLILVGSIPAGLVGVLLDDYIEQLFGSLTYVGLFWLVTSLLLWVLGRLPEGGSPRATLGVGGALLIGVFQSAAIAPGISRSGATIVGGVLAGLNREEAANFSFLLSLPAIAGAAALDVVGLELTASVSLPWNALAAGSVAAALSGYLAITWLLALLRRGKLSHFAYYTLFLGAATILSSLM